MKGYQDNESHTRQRIRTEEKLPLHSTQTGVYNVTLVKNREPTYFLEAVGDHQPSSGFLHLRPTNSGP